MLDSSLERHNLTVDAEDLEAVAGGRYRNIPVTLDNKTTSILEVEVGVYVRFGVWFVKWQYAKTITPNALTLDVVVIKRVLAHLADCSYRRHAA